MTVPADVDFNCPDCDTIVGKANPYKQLAEIAVPI
jgi:hypothetical protein